MNSATASEFDAVRLEHRVAALELRDRAIRRASIRRRRDLRAILFALALGLVVAATVMIGGSLRIVHAPDTNSVFPLAAQIGTALNALVLLVLSILPRIGKDRDIDRAEIGTDARSGPADAG